MITVYEYNILKKNSCYGNGKHTTQSQIQMNYRFLLWLKFYDARIFSFVSDLEETQTRRLSDMAYELGRKGKKEQFMLQCSGHSSHYLSSLQETPSFSLPPQNPALWLTHTNLMAEERRGYEQ
jgi:hypothetical protein